jgi:phosphatidylserine/phosphatidylglycerophosphate/cardiolipin synthase-like enzyme
VVRSRRLGARGLATVAATVVCAALLATSGQVAAGGATPVAAPAAANESVSAGPFSKTEFNLPNSAFYPDIRKLEMSLIEDAPDGSAIELSAYRFTDVALARKLVRDARNGVQVEVLLDGGVPANGCAGASNCVNPAYTVLQKLNSSYGPGSPTWLRTCAGIGPSNPWTQVGIGRGCIGQDLNHNKFLLLSDVPYLGQEAHDVVFQTSSNNTPSQYRHALNNAVVIANRPPVYQDYLRYFQQLTLNSTSNAETSSQWFNPFTGNHLDTTTLADHDIATWSFPRPPGDDPVANVLGDVSTANRCANRIGTATGPKHTKIKAAIADIKGRGPLIRQLATLQESGCRVVVAFATITPRDKHLLRRSGAQLDEVCTIPDRQKYPNDVNQYVHSKYLLVEGTDNNLGRNRRIVYTGSENWTNKSLSGSDNLMMRYVEPANGTRPHAVNSPLFDHYDRNFRALQLISAANKEKAHCAAADR